MLHVRIFRFLSHSLVRTDVIEELVNLITTEPSQELHEAIQYKNPNMACELLTADVAAICDKLADTEVSSTIFHRLMKPWCNSPECPTFALATIASPVNPNVDVTPTLTLIQILILTLPRTKNPIITLNSLLSEISLQEQLSPEQCWYNINS